MRKGDWDKEEAKVVKLIGEALSAVKEVMSSDYWGYVKEYELGRLDIAKYILQLTYDELVSVDKLKWGENSSTKTPSIVIPPELLGGGKPESVLASESHHRFLRGLRKLDDIKLLLDKIDKIIAEVKTETVSTG